MEKLIEKVLPLQAINAEALRERAGRPGNPANLHMWWGRSPQASSRAALAAALLEDSEDLSLVARVAAGEAEAIAEVRARVLALPQALTVFDPFAGFGGIPLAALELGMGAVASDLNPVAVTLTRAVTDIPTRFAGLAPIHPGAPRREAYSGAEGLAEDVRFFGEWLEDQALKRLAEAYPQMEGGQLPWAWLWVRTVKCPNPVCGCQMPLGSSFVLASSKSAQFWAEPIVEGELLRFHIHEGACPEGREGNKVGSNGARFRCPVCGEITTDEYVKERGLAHELGEALMAVVVESGGRRSFLAPDARQYAAAQVPTVDAPAGSISRNTRWFSPPGFGLTEFADIFTRRQILTLVTFSDLVREAQDMAASAALAAGLSADGGTLEAGGAGALAYGQAVGVYLALVVDRLADYHSSMCSWRATGSSLRNTFGRQAIPMIWVFAEGNPFSVASGNFKTLLASVARSVESLICTGRVAVTCADAAAAEGIPSSIVCTELPYYRDIGYADLSDFFYIWLRRSLKYAYPELFSPMVTPKKELSTVSSYSGVPRQEAEEDYRTKRRTVLSRLYAASSLEYPALIFYCFRRGDLESMSGGAEGSAWELMVEDLLDTGFSVTALWPLRSEPVNEKADSTRVLIVARRGAKRRAQTTRRAFLATLRRELPARLEQMLAGGVDEADELISSLGQGVAVYTSFQAVLNADGSPVCVHDAMQIIYLECKDYLANRRVAMEEE